MVNISGSEISKTLNEMLGELRRLPELHLDKLYTIGSILVSIGEVKKIPTLKIIGKNLYLIPERLRPWLLAKGSAYGGVPEVERLMKAVGDILNNLVKVLERIAEMLEHKEELTDDDLSSSLNEIDNLVSTLPTPRE